MSSTATLCSAKRPSWRSRKQSTAKSPTTLSLKMKLLSDFVANCSKHLQSTRPNGPNDASLPTLIYVLERSPRRTRQCLWNKTTCCCVLDTPCEAIRPTPPLHCQCLEERQGRKQNYAKEFDAVLRWFWSQRFSFSLVSYILHMQPRNVALSPRTGIPLTSPVHAKYQ